MKKIKNIETIKNTLKYIVLIGVLIIILFPIFWVISTSFKVPNDYYSSPPVWIPSEITIDHYYKLFTTYGASPYIINSIIIASGATIFVMLLSIPAAYSMSKYRIGGEKFSFWILSLRMLPPVVAIIPLFILFIQLKLIDTYIGLILPYLIFNIPFAIWLLISFFKDIPPELHESAMVDGCTEVGAMVKIILPLMSPGIVVVSLFTFIFTWNDLLLALSLSRSHTKTLMVLIASTMQSPTGIFFGAAAASATIGIIPVFLITLFLQRYLVKGLTLGGVKG